MELEFDLENPLSTSHDLHAHTLNTLFHNESDHMPSNTSDCFTCTRREIISLILHFSRKFNRFLSFLAINYLDRYLSVQPLPEGKPWIFRLVAVCCISLALKMSTETKFSLMDIQHDDSEPRFDSRTIERMEYLILNSLKWRMRSITPFSFINFFLSLFKLKDRPFTQALKARATEVIFQAQNEMELLEFKPSIIAASALLYASHELFPLQFPCYNKAILNCSYVNKDNLLSCYNVMQHVLMDEWESNLDMESSMSTPVNVLDLHCSTSSSATEKQQIQMSKATDQAADATANGTARHQQLERHPKRRKIGESTADTMTSFLRCSSV